MKKFRLLSLLLSTVLVCGFLIGCSTNEPEGNPMALYSFSGEDDRFSLSSGIIAITDQETVIYGGELENTGEHFTTFHPIPSVCTF